MAAQSGKSFRSILGVPPSKPSAKDSVLVIVDAQNEYDHGLLAISDVKSSRAVIGDVLGKWREGGGDVVHVRHITPDGAPVFTPKTELADEFAELTAGAKETEKVVLKQHPSSFTGTDLAEHLDKLGKKKIVLAGILTLPPPCQLRTICCLGRADEEIRLSNLGYMAHVCISNTSRAGAELGYDVSVLADGIGDRDIPGASARQLVETTLAELGDVSATVVRSGDL